MKKQIHISDARRILDTGAVVDLKVWKSNGEILEYNGVITTSSHFRGGTRQLKFEKSGEVRRVRDVCIFGINGMEVYL